MRSLSCMARLAAVGFSAIIPRHGNEINIAFKTLPSPSCCSLHMQRQRTCRFVSRMVRRSRWSRPETCLTGRRTSVQRLRPLDSWMIVNVAGYSCVGYSASSSNNRRWCGMSESKMSPTRNPLLIENDSPNVTANLWTGRGSAIPFSAKYLPWFFQRGGQHSSLPHRNSGEIRQILRALPGAALLGR